MNSYLDIGPASQSEKAFKLQEPHSSHMSDGLFQQYLDTNSDKWSPAKLTPDTIRTLSTTLISALDRASMHATFFDVNSGQENSPSSLLSTDFFMAIRSSGTIPMFSVLEKPANPSVPVPAPVSIPTSAPTYKLAADTKDGKQISETLPSAGSTRGKYATMIAAAAASLGLDPKLIEAVVQTESDFNARAVSPVGAQGLMQLMPGTAAELGVTDAFNPEQNIQAGSRYLKQLMDRYDGDTKLTLAAYNWGMGNLERHPESMPQETVNYVAKITNLMNKAA